MTVATEVWWVADDTAAAPAHLVTYQQAGVTATACNWIPRREGLYLSRVEMLTRCRFACTCCLHVAAHRPMRRVA